MSPAAILDFVIRREETSVNFFSVWSCRAGDVILREIFRSLLMKTSEGISALKNLRQDSEYDLGERGVPVDSFREVLVDVQPRREMTDMQALAFAGIRAETSEKLYKRLSIILPDPRLRDLFTKLEGDVRIYGQLCNCVYDRRLEAEP
jgi:hypothetical protein